MWRPIVSGAAVLEAAIDTDQPFTGAQSQRITFARGEGEVGIENQGLNRWGLALVAANHAKDTSGFAVKNRSTLSPPSKAATARARTPKPASPSPAMIGGAMTSPSPPPPPTAPPASPSASSLPAPSPSATSSCNPASGAALRACPYGATLSRASLTRASPVLRYGGSMVNEPEYRWKKMIGPRDRRPPYHGHWYPHSTNGWGIVDFLDLCDAAGFLAIPDFNIDETPEDLADFIEYANGPADSAWGRRRAADGHPAPYNLRQIELGNEEKIDDVYFQKFQRLAQAVWAKDPHVILVAGDFQYERPITDPNQVQGAASRITSLAAHKKLLDLAKQNGREIWFDVHTWTQGPAPSPSAIALKSYVDAIDKLADGAKHHVVVFEFNANNHDHRRALANANAIAEIIRDGRVPVALSANGLQPDGQNDNGWDQGLLFLNPSKTWLQPPGYVTQMFAQNYQPRVLDIQVENSDAKLNVVATRSDDGKQIVLHVINLDTDARPAKIRLDGLTPTDPVATLEQLAGPLNAANTAENPTEIIPKRLEWRHDMKDGAATFVFPPLSYTVLRIH